MAGDKAAVVAAWNTMKATVQSIVANPPPPPPPVPVLAVGARCKAINKPLVAVRPTPDATPNPPTQPIGALGTVIAPGLVNGYWRVNFDTGPDGYVWAANLVAV